MTEERLLNEDEAAEYLAISKRQLRRLREREEIGFVKSGRSVCFTKEDLSNYIKKHRTPARY